MADAACLETPPRYQLYEQLHRVTQQKVKKRPSNNNNNNNNDYNRLYLAYPVPPGDIKDAFTAVEDMATCVAVWTDDGFIAAISKILQHRDVFKTSSVVKQSGV